MVYYKYFEPQVQNIIEYSTRALEGGVTRASGLKSRVTRAGTRDPGFQPSGTRDATFEVTRAIFYNISNLRFEIFVI